MRISGTKPSSVILSQICCVKNLTSNDQKVPKQAEAKRDGVINPQIFKLQFQSILNTENLDALQTPRIKRSRP